MIRLTLLVPALLSFVATIANGSLVFAATAKPPAPLAPCGGSKCVGFEMSDVELHQDLGLLDREHAVGT